MIAIVTGLGERAELRADLRWHAADADVARVLNLLLGPDGVDLRLSEMTPADHDHAWVRADRAVALLGGRILTPRPAPLPDRDETGNPIVY